MSNRQARRTDTTAQVSGDMLHGEQAHQCINLLPRSGRLTGVGLLVQHVFSECHLNHLSCSSRAFGSFTYMQSRYVGFSGMYLMCSL